RGDGVSDSLRIYEVSKLRLSYAVAVLHTCDLDGIARIHERLTSPQALIEGLRPSDQENADYRLALINTARKLRDLTPLGADGIEAVEQKLRPELRYEGGGGEEVAGGA